MMTLLDFIFVTVMLLSGVLGAGRGFLRVMIAVLCCAAAQLVTALVHDITASSIVISGMLFLGTLIMFLVLAARISHNISDSRVGTVDRTVGFLFGLVRGLLIVVVTFLFYAWLVPDRSQPGWIRGAKSRVVLQGTGDWLMSMLPEGDDKGFNLILTSVAGLIVDGIVLSIVVDLFAIVTGSMGRRR
jgi:membrane protein required for colicin V production